MSQRRQLSRREAADEWSDRVEPGFGQRWKQVPVG